MNVYRVVKKYNVSNHLDQDCWTQRSINVLAEDCLSAISATDNKGIVVETRLIAEDVIIAPVEKTE